jgi:sugar O-acyltransferase (sialic acid O-acetyltransferase NeuD family)
MKKLIIFGLGEQAELAYFYFKNETNYQIEAFTVNQEFIIEDTFIDSVPVAAFEDLENKFTPEEYDGFIAIGYRKVNALRSGKFYEFKQKGYRLATFISSKATNYATSVGENCFILEDNTIQPFVKIGNNVTLWSGNHIGHHSVIGNHCFITSQVVISGGCTIGDSTFIGVNSTLRDHIKIGQSNMIGAGSLVLADTDDRNVFMEKATEVSRVPSNRLRGI